MRPFLLTIAIAIALTLPRTFPARGQAHLVVKMATTAASGSPLVRQLQRLAAIIEQRTAGLILVKLFPDGRLGDDAALLSALRAGAIQIYAGDFNAVAGVAEDVRVLSSPYLFRDYAHADQQLDGPLREPMRAALSAHGMVFAAWGPSVFGRWFSQGPPPRSPKGFSGLSVVGMAGAHDAREWQALGANPLTGPERLPAQAGPWLWRTTTVAARAHGRDRRATHVTRADDVLSGHVIALSKRWFFGLPARFKQALSQLPHDPTRVARAEARALDRELARRMAARGQTLVTLTRDERAQFLAFGARLSEETTGESGRHATALLQAMR